MSENAPEKIYIDLLYGDEYGEWSKEREDPADIEYTRSPAKVDVDQIQAIIEKAVIEHFSDRQNFCMETVEIAHKIVAILEKGSDV